MPNCLFLNNKSPITASLPVIGLVISLHFISYLSILLKVSKNEDILNSHNEELLTI